MSSATTYWTRDPSGTLISERTGTNHYYYDFDGLGSVVAVIGSTGTVLDTYSYDPYGKLRASTGTTANPFQYTSGYLDATGLYHNGARYYDTNLGRFTQQDPAGQGPNLYSYAGNSPTNNVDPSGLSFWSTLGSAVSSGFQYGLAGFSGGFITGAIGGCLAAIWAAGVGCIAGAVTGAASTAAIGYLSGFTYGVTTSLYGYNGPSSLV